MFGMFPYGYLWLFDKVTKFQHSKIRKLSQEHKADARVGPGLATPLTVILSLGDSIQSLIINGKSQSFFPLLNHNNVRGPWRSAWSADGWSS